MAGPVMDAVQAQFGAQETGESTTHQHAAGESGEQQLCHSTRPNALRCFPCREHGHIQAACPK